MSEPYGIGTHRGKFVIRHFEEGRGWVRTSLGTDDRGLAEARARRIWSARTAPASERIADLWPAYVRDRRASGVTSERFDPTWKALKPHFGHRLGTAIERSDCRTYHEARRAEGKADSTIKTELELLRACLRWRYGTSKVWVPPASAPRERYLTRDELTRLLRFIATPHVRLFVILAVTTGARMSTILDARWEQVDLERGTIDYMPAGRHKTNKRRPLIPLNSRALEALKEARAGALTDYVIEWNGAPVASVKKAIRMAAKRSGIPCSPHVFRHTAGVWMAEANLPMQKIAQYLGHTSSKITEQVYARYSPTHMRDAAEVLNF